MQYGRKLLFNECKNGDRIYMSECASQLYEISLRVHQLDSLSDNKERLTKLINITRDDFPSNTLERIRYIKRVKECNALIDKIQFEDFEYIDPCLIYSNTDKIAYIIGWKYHQIVSTHRAKIVKNKCGNKCIVCDFPITETLNAHHIIPRHLGGKNDESNLIALCPTCHKIFHIIEDNMGITDVLYNYLTDQGYLQTVLKYTRHMFGENYSLKL